MIFSRKRVVKPRNPKAFGRTEQAWWDWYEFQPGRTIVSDFGVYEQSGFHFDQKAFDSNTRAVRKRCSDWVAGLSDDGPKDGAS